MHRKWKKTNFQKLRFLQLYFSSKTWNIPKILNFYSLYSNTYFIHKTEVTATIIWNWPYTKILCVTFCEEYMWNIVIVCQIEEELLYRNHFCTDRQTDSHGETSIPPQLRWRGYTILFSMWRNRWKMTPWTSKFHRGSHFFTTFGSKFNIKIFFLFSVHFSKLSSRH